MRIFCGPRQVHSLLYNLARCATLFSGQTGRSNGNIDSTANKNGLLSVKIKMTFFIRYARLFLIILPASALLRPRMPFFAPEDVNRDPGGAIFPARAVAGLF